MCGIVGGRYNSEQDPNHLTVVADQMLTALLHRGPDDGGFTVSHSGFIGNRRLKIFDLSDAGNQPFFNDDGSLALVLNGEIYNHVELRRELESKYIFRSHADTEVLLRAYEEWGCACVDRFIGMFAFAIWHAKEQRLLLCRDRLGIKPLYYHDSGTRLLFASEIKAILVAGVQAESNIRVLRDYLVDGRYDHTRETFFKGIQMLRPGSFLIADAAGTREVTYWDPYIASVRHKDDIDPQSVYWETLEDSVKLRMRADVPYAVMLSGGLDSSALSVIAEKHVQGGKLTVCTFRHRDERYDEGPWADLVANDHNWLRHEVFVSESDVAKLLTKALWHQDEPFGGVATFADVMLADIARQHGIYVLLEGQGADETLAGYEYYYAYHLADLSDSNENAARLLFDEYANLRGIPSCRRETELARFIRMGRGDVSALGQDGTAISQQGAVATGLILSEGTGYADPVAFGTRLENALFRDLFYTKLPRVLRFKDKASMMYGVELRVPFLDHRLVEVSFGINAKDKLSGGYTKMCLRRQMQGRLPDQTCLHVKRPVQTPQREWLRGLLKPMVDEVVYSASFASRDIFNVARVQALYKDYIQKPDNYSNSFFVWQWLMTEMWFRLFVDGKDKPGQTRVAHPRNERREWVPSCQSQDTDA